MLVADHECEGAARHADEHPVYDVTLADAGVSDTDDVGSFDGLWPSGLLDSDRMRIDGERFAFYVRCVHECDDDLLADFDGTDERVPGAVGFRTGGSSGLTCEAARQGGVMSGRGDRVPDGPE